MADVQGSSSYLNLREFLLMKLMVLCIDGCDKRIVNKAPMPFLQQLIDENCGVEVEEDLYSRGWAEFYLGRHAADTGAFYFRPQVDGKCGLSGKLDLSKILDFPNVKPIWEVVSCSGLRTGVMNIPTVFPPQPIGGGFFVAGSAGGGSVAGVAKSVSRTNLLFGIDFKKIDRAAIHFRCSSRTWNSFLQP